MDSFLWVSHRLGMGGEGSFSIKTRITLGGTNPPSPGVSGTRGFLKLHPQDGPWVPAGAGGQALCQGALGKPRTRAAEKDRGFMSSVIPAAVGGSSLHHFLLLK